MWPFKRPKQPSPLGDTEVSERILEELRTVKDFIERLEVAEKDIVNINTALNRIERKQSRWIELLNEKEDPAKVALLQGQPVNSIRREPELGEETL